MPSEFESEGQLGAPSVIEPLVIKSRQAALTQAATQTTAQKGRYSGCSQPSKSCLTENSSSESQLLNEPPDTHTNYSRVLVAAMDLLARREHSQAELINKLKRRFQESIVIEEVAEQLQAENLQSDQRYAETLVRYYGDSGKGPNYIRRELVRQGVCEVIISEYLQDQDEHWLERIEQVSKKKYHLPPVDFQERAKRFRFFQSRGYTSEQIQYVLDLND